MEKGRFLVSPGSAKKHFEFHQEIICFLCVPSHLEMFHKGSQNMTICFLAWHEKLDLDAACHWDGAPCESMLGVISEAFFFSLRQVVQET